MIVTTELPPLAERVVSESAGNVHVLALRPPVERIVTFEGSFLTFPAFEDEEEIQQQLVVGLLDKGTRAKDRFEIAEALENRGARLGFSADGLRCSFSGRCLIDDFAFVVAILAEQLRQPLFDPAEFEKARVQQIAAVRRIMEDTGSQAHAALTRAFCDPAHPNHRPEAETDLRHLAALSVEHVVGYHAGHFGARDAWIAVAGDIEPGQVVSDIQGALGDWPEARLTGEYSADALDRPASRVEVPIDDRPNLDVRIGHPVALRRDDDDYLPLYVGVYILGGNFSARLMSTVRDEQGLTYGIGSSISGASIHHDCYFLTSVTLSREHLDRGIAATLEQIRLLVDDGVTAEELAEKQTTLTGAFKVGLATTRGLASALLSNAERGFDVGYLDEFAARINALTVDRVNGALRRHLRPDDLHIAVAGTLSE